MFGTIRRHQSWLWGLIIASMIVGLIYWTDQSTSRGGRGGSRRSAKGPAVNGKVITQRMLDEAAREVKLLYYLNTGKWPDQERDRLQQMGWDEETQAYLRLFRTGKADELGVQASDDAVRALLQRLLGDPSRSEQFVKERLQPVGLTADDFVRFLVNDVKMQQMGGVVAAAGRMIAPAEAEGLYRRSHQELGGDIVFFPLSNYLSKVVITNGALTNYFGPRQSIYRVPDRIRVSYVEFAKSNFLADADKELNLVTNLNMKLQEAYFKLGGTNHFKDTNGVPLTEEKAMAKIKEDERERMAFNFAFRRANEFANKLYDRQPQRAENLDALAKDEGLQVQVTMPFDQTEGLTNLEVSSKFTEIAFKLDATNNPVSVQPIGGENGVYIIALKEKIPWRAQTFDEVRDKVSDDYTKSIATTLAQNEGTNFLALATNAMAQGKTFDEMVLQYNAIYQAALKSEAVGSPGTELEFAL